jgi:hypothetical protein
MHVHPVHPPWVRPCYIALFNLRIQSKGSAKQLDPDQGSAKYPDSEKYLDPDSAKYLDPDPYSAKYLDPDSAKYR